MKIWRITFVSVLLSVLLGSIAWQSVHRIHHYFDNKEKECALYTEPTQGSVFHHSHGDLSFHCDSCTLAVVAEVTPFFSETATFYSIYKNPSQNFPNSTSWIDEQQTYKSLRAPPVLA